MLKPFSTLFLTAISTRRQVHVAEGIGMATSPLNRRVNGEEGWSAEDIDRICALLGLRLTRDDGSQVTIPKDEYQALRLFARRGLDQGEAA